MAPGGGAAHADAALPVWVDGGLRPAEAAGDRGSPPGFRAPPNGLGCYTTARYEGGRLRHAIAVSERLARDAARLGLPPVDPAAVRDGLLALARACFGSSAGIVRMQANATPSGRLRLVGSARPVGAEPPSWRVRTAPTRHPGPGPCPGVKLADHATLEHLRGWLRERGDADEALLYDPAGRLVEGTRSTPFLCLADGAWVTPPLARGGVAGVARSLVLAACDEVREADVGAADVARSRELVMTNSVRGARPVSAIDGAPRSAAGPLLDRLAEALAGEA